jgi:hypothetical protein
MLKGWEGVGCVCVASVDGIWVIVMLYEVVTRLGTNGGNFFRVILHMGERASCFAVVGFCFCFLIFPSPRDPGLGSWFEAAIFGGWAYL